MIEKRHASLIFACCQTWKYTGMAYTNMFLLFNF